MWTDPIETCRGLLAQGRAADAETQARLALDEAKRRFGGAHANVALGNVALGEVLLAERRAAEALAPLQRALKALMHEGGLARLRAADVLDTIALAHEHLGDLHAAERALRESLEIREKDLGADHPECAKSLEGLARLYGEGRFEDANAEGFLVRARAILEAAGPAYADRTAALLHDLGVFYLKARRLQQAREVFERALHLRIASEGETGPDVAPAVRDLAMLFAERGELHVAERLCRMALALVDRQNGPDSPEAVDLVLDLADIARRLGRQRDSLSLYFRAIRLRREIHGPDDVDAAELEAWVESWITESARREATSSFH